VSEDRGKMINGAMRWIHKHFSEVWRRIPVNVRPFSLGYGVIDGMATHPALVEREWCESRGYQKFEAADVPDGFFLAGIQNKGTSEYLLAMMVQGERRFWFYDPYVCFVAKTDRSPERTRAALQEALVAWDRGDQRVFYSGVRGGWVDGNKDEDGIPWL
jgi:hypothetical protein